MAHLPRAPFFHCTACDEDISALHLSVDVAGHAFCMDCFSTGIQPQFEAALRDEADYPPTMGGVTLNIMRFQFLLPQQLVADYIEKSKEYDTLPKQRVYCEASPECKRFLGPVTERKVLHNCECDTVTCMCCRKIVTNAVSGEVALPHDCPGYKDDGDSFQRHMLPEDTRGRDWQICPGPGCKVLVTLQDGCNHVACSISACKTQFCFVCGKPIDINAGRGHWLGGDACPRYGYPGMPVPRRNALNPLAFEQPRVADAARDFDMLGMFGARPGDRVRLPGTIEQNGRPLPADPLQTPRDRVPVGEYGDALQFTGELPDIPRLNVSQPGPVRGPRDRVNDNSRQRSTDGLLGRVRQPYRTNVDAPPPLTGEVPRQARVPVTLMSEEFRNMHQAAVEENVDGRAEHHAPTSQPRRPTVVLPAGGWDRFSGPLTGLPPVRPSVVPGRARSENPDGDADIHFLRRFDNLFTGQHDVERNSPREVDTRDAETLTMQQPTRSISRARAEIEALRRNNTLRFRGFEFPEAPDPQLQEDGATMLRDNVADDVVNLTEDSQHAGAEPDQGTARLALRTHPGTGNDGAQPRLWDREPATQLTEEESRALLLEAEDEGAVERRDGEATAVEDRDEISNEHHDGPASLNANSV